MFQACSKRPPTVSHVFLLCVFNQSVLQTHSDNFPLFPSVIPTWSKRFHTVFKAVPQRVPSLLQSCCPCFPRVLQAFCAFSQRVLNVFLACSERFPNGCQALLKRFPNVLPVLFSNVLQACSKHFPIVFPAAFFQKSSKSVRSVFPASSLCVPMKLASPWQNRNANLVWLWYQCYTRLAFAWTWLKLLLLLFRNVRMTHTSCHARYSDPVEDGKGHHKVSVKTHF